MQNLENADLYTLFALRYAVDKKHDLVDLKQDVLDLQGFPERIEISYQAEWRSYVKKELHRLQRSSNSAIAELEAQVNELQSGHNDEFNGLLSILKTATAVNNSEEVSVISTPVKKYVHQLLQL